MKGKSILAIIIVVIILITSMPSFPFQSTEAAVERILVTADADYQPGFYWCQHGDGRWSTYSSFSDQTYWRDDAGGQPANHGQRVETFADIASPTGMVWKDAHEQLYSFARVLEPEPSKVVMQTNADPNLQGQPRVEPNDQGINQVVISGIVGEGVSGRADSDICGGNPGYIYSFAVTVTFIGYIEREIPEHDIVIKHFTTSGQSLSHIFPDVREVMLEGEMYPPPSPTHADYLYEGHKKTTTGNEPIGPIIEGLPPSVIYDGGNPFTLFYYYKERQDDEDRSVNARFHITPDPVPYGSSFTFHPTNVQNDTGKEIIHTEWRVRNPSNVSQVAAFERTSINDRSVTFAQYPAWMHDETRNYLVDMYVQLQGESEWRFMDTQMLRIISRDLGEPDPNDKLTASFIVNPSSNPYGATFSLEPQNVFIPKGRTLDHIAYTIFSPDRSQQRTYYVNHIENLYINQSMYPAFFSANITQSYPVDMVLTDSSGATTPVVTRNVTMRMSNLTPIADFTLPPQVMEGDHVQPIIDRSYDPDGHIVDWEWTVTPQGRSPIEAPHEMVVGGHFPAVCSPGDTITFHLVVTDNQGATGSISKDTVCMAPIPHAWIKADMEQQTVNRYVTIDNQLSFSPATYPILHHLNEWEITPLDGQTDFYFGNAQGYASVPTQDSVMYLQSKQLGRFDIRAKVSNARATSEWTEPILVTIIPDTFPDLNLSGQNQVYRDPNGQAEMMLQYSARTPLTTERLRSIRVQSRFDQQNNHFASGATAWQLEAMFGNNEREKEVKLTRSHAGNYQYRVTASKEIDHSIRELLNEEDYPSTQRTLDVEVKNIEPSVSLSAMQKPQANIKLVLVDLDENKENALQNAANTIRGNLFSQGVNANVDVSTLDTDVLLHEGPDHWAIRDNAAFNVYERLNYYTDRFHRVPFQSNIPASHNGTPLANQHQPRHYNDPMLIQDLRYPLIPLDAYMDSDNHLYVIFGSTIRVGIDHKYYSIFRINTNNNTTVWKQEHITTQNVLNGQHMTGSRISWRLIMPKGENSLYIVDNVDSPSFIQKINKFNGQRQDIGTTFQNRDQLRISLENQKQQEKSILPVTEEGIHGSIRHEEWRSQGTSVRHYVSFYYAPPGRPEKHVFFAGTNLLNYDVQTFRFKNRDFMLVTIGNTRSTVHLVDLTEAYNLGQLQDRGGSNFNQRFDYAVNHDYIRNFAGCLDCG